MTLRISTDVGGTFTDVVAVDAEGSTAISKSLSTPEDPVDGMLQGLRLVAESRGESLQSLLSSCDLFGHGSTIATNALLEGNTARVGLICTKGHRDVLLFREGGKQNPFDWDLDYPEPFVPRRLTIGVTERVSSEGQVIVPLDEDEARRAVIQLRGSGVDVIAVALLWSFLNPVHELRVAELIADEWPEVSFSLSHIVNPVIREYRRTVGTAVDASLLPLVSGYVGRLNARLADEGYRGTPHLLTSSGGMTSAEELIARPVYAVDSGPAVAPVAARFFARRELDAGNVIACDMGGTSFDVSRVTEGTLGITSDWQLGEERLSLPKVDVRSIGAGGGSVAWVDRGGLVRVGPQSTGSRPGPACYGRGGADATVTDAALLLGYYDPQSSFGGDVALDVPAAQEAIGRNVAAPLGVDVLTAAFTIWATVCGNMTEAIRDITIRQGVDPREYVMVAGGGAAGAHIVPIAAGLGVDRLIVPRVASVLSAFGGAVADLVREYHQAFLTSTDDFGYEGVNQVLGQLTDLSGHFLDELHVPKEQRRLQYSVEARYPFQERELDVPLRRTVFSSTAHVQEVLEDFHEVHEQQRGSREPGQVAELTLWKVRAIGATSHLDAVRAPALPSPSAKATSRRRAYFALCGGMVDTPVCDPSGLSPDVPLDGPAIIEEPTTTIVLFPGSRAVLSDQGCYIIELGGPDEGAFGHPR